MAFDAQYDALCPEHPEWGAIAVLPWDAELFGFAVADYRLGSCPAIQQSLAGFQRALLAYARDHAVELIACSAAGDDPQALALLAAAGFVFFDYTLAISLSRLHTRRYAAPPIPVRAATPDDQPEVERIAEQVFHYGRYHADPYIPRHLANYRYRRWLTNAFAHLGSDSRIFVVGPPGAVYGFAHAELHGHVANLTITAVAEPFQRGPATFSLALGCLRGLKAAGVRKLVGKVSAANLGILNLTAGLGFRYAKPQATFYWHAPGARHLASPHASQQRTDSSPDVQAP